MIRQDDIERYWDRLNFNEREILIDEYCGIDLKEFDRYVDTAEWAYYKYVIKRKKK